MDSLMRIIDDLVFPWPVRCRACESRAMPRSLFCEKCHNAHASDRPIINFADADGVDASAAAHRYTSQAAAMVRTFKFSAMRALARDMAEDMLSAARFAGYTKPDRVAFVPMHWTRRRMRFYNHSRILAKMIAREMGAEIMTGLVRTRYCRQQSRIHDDEKRRKNVAGAFRVKEDISGQKILLIDDVYTTGATAGECAMALKAAGADKVLLLTYSTAHASHS